MKLCTTFERNRAIRGGVIAILVFDLMTLNIALRVALGSEIIICPIAIAYSMGQIIKSVCVCVSVCVSVCLSVCEHSHGRIS